MMLYRAILILVACVSHTSSSIGYWSARNSDDVRYTFYRTYYNVASLSWSNTGSYCHVHAGGTYIYAYLLALPSGKILWSRYVPYNGGVRQYFYQLVSTLHFTSYESQLTGLRLYTPNRQNQAFHDLNDADISLVEGLTWVPTRMPVTIAPTELPTQLPTTTAPTQLPTELPVTKAPTQPPTYSRLTNVQSCSEIDYTASSGLVCKSVGDPHVFPWEGTEMPLQSATGDYVMYFSSLLRIDIRMLPFTFGGFVSSSVTGNHAIAIEVTDGNCAFKLEIYNKHQTESGEEQFLFNGTDVGWNDLVDIFSSCDYLCSDTNLWEVNQDNNEFTVTFADGVMISIQHVDNMQSLYITVPYGKIEADSGIIEEKQLCKGDVRLLNCRNDTAIFSHYGYDETLGRYMLCNETMGIVAEPPKECFPNVEYIAQEVCADCEAPCLIPSLVESCKFDVCFVPGLEDAWNSPNRTQAWIDAKEVAEGYCAATKDEITNKPWLCPSEPTPIPTEILTWMPTNLPTTYINDVENMVFKGVGTSCRGGLKSSWPGGFTCTSPYIICLPQENTPANFLETPYKSSKYRYTVDECLQECANDQRCLGAEFVADADSATGDCNLIDDNPPVITSQIGNFSYNFTTAYINLDSSLTGGEVLCFKKEEECYPYFEADDLNEVMLETYCPNNRKGYYTKKVKRTVDTTRFCGFDTEIDKRIKKAQANRMFHLCENWCLFQTEDPESESWFWNPWKLCWREQYSDSYCNRVINGTIEMEFVKHRSTLFCQLD